MKALIIWFEINDVEHEISVITVMIALFMCI